MTSRIINKNKIYLVDIDNGESYEDYRHSVDKVFSTYRGASQWLIDEGYEPYESYNHNDQEPDISFRWEESDEYMADSSNADIIEMEVEE